MAILDQFGRPYEAPPAAINTSATAGVRNPATAWTGVASALSPARAAQVLRDAKAGDADAYLTLAEEIEERDLQYSGVLQTRKLAAVGVEPEVKPADDSPRADEIATEYRKQVVETDAFAGLLFDFMDALAKGYSVVQPIWETSESQWNYQEFRWEDPRLFQFDASHLRELRLKQEGSADGQELPPGQFVMHRPRIKTGVTLRGGLAMLATIAHVAKSYTLADWLAFCEVYGMPLRIAEYDPDVMTQQEINALKIALANIGHDAAALIPKGADIRIEDGRRPNANGKNVFEGLANYWDAQLSKAVLGQTMTTDDGSSKAQAEVHEGVALKYTKSDVRSLVATTRAGITVPWVAFNYGDEAARTLVPEVVLPVEPPEDLVQFTAAVLPWVERGGLTVRAAEIRGRFGLEAPDGEDENAVIGLPEHRAPGDPVGTNPAESGGAPAE